jgi:hypothetical protein
MTRIRSIYGLPNEVTQKYINTLMYFDKGHMMDWIWKSLQELEIDSSDINFFKESSEPPDFLPPQIKAYFKELREHIEKGLIQNGFERDFIIDGVFQIQASPIDQSFGKISIQCFLTTGDFKILKGKVHTEKVSPISNSLFERILKTKN